MLWADIEIKTHSQYANNLTCCIYSECVFQIKLLPAEFIPCPMDSLWVPSPSQLKPGCPVPISGLRDWAVLQSNQRPLNQDPSGEEPVILVILR